MFLLRNRSYIYLFILFERNKILTVGFNDLGLFMMIETLFVRAYSSLKIHRFLDLICMEEKHHSSCREGKIEILLIYP